MKRTVLLCLLGLAACDDDTAPIARRMAQSPSDVMDGGSDAAANQDGAEQPDEPPDARIIELNEAAIDAGDDAARDGGTDAAQDAGIDDKTGATARCPAYSKQAIVEIEAGPLSLNLFQWTCDNIYVLKGVVYVHSVNANDPQVLTIQPGTLIRGQKESILVVTRNARIDAQGTVEDPIVFTSAQPVGARKRGDWGGLTLLGAGYKANGGRPVEGFPATADRALLAYGPRNVLGDAGITQPDGGSDAGSDAGAPVVNDTHNCGVLRYVRVEFASNFVKASDESNGIQLYACGSQTKLDYVQVHKSDDDGVEVFGGSAQLSHLVLTGDSDEGLDFDEGWRGRAQFVVIQQHPDGADLGIEAGSTDELAPDARLFNFTMIGTNNVGQGSVGIRLRGDTRAYLRNTIMLGFSAGAVDVDGSKTAENYGEGSLSIQSSIFWRASATRLFPAGNDDKADSFNNVNLEEEVELRRESRHNQVVDPQLPDPFNVLAPKWLPKSLPELLGQHAETPSERLGEEAFFDTRAKYIGAFAPGGEDWTMGWTAYPES